MLTSKDPAQHTTILFLQIRQGDDQALDALMPYVYDELYTIAKRQLRRTDRAKLLNTTALVHEVYLRLIDQTRVSVNDKAHFFALTARMMRQILVDLARKRSAQKRGGADIHITLDDVNISDMERPDLLLALDEALQTLHTHNPQMAQLVEYRFFAGMTMAEIAAVMDTSERTLARLWRRARAYLYQTLQADA